MSNQKQRAFLLFGGFITCKHPAYSKTVKDLGYALLVLDLVTPSTQRQVEARTTIPDHALSWIDAYHFIEADDVAGAFACVRAWQHRYRIEAVHNLREDFVELAALVADWLEVPSPGLKAARICRDKFLQRLYLQADSPAFTLVRKEDLAMLTPERFPFVLKPTRRQGSSGVKLVTGLEDLHAAIDEYEAGEALLMEDYVLGADYSVESILVEGRLLFGEITRKKTNHHHQDSPYFVGMSYTMPAQDLNPETRKALLAVNARLLKRLAFRSGITHVEFKINAEGRIYFIEVAARNPGSGIMQLYEMAFGIPLEEVLIKIMAGVPAPVLAKPTRITRNIYFNHRPGTLVGVDFKDNTPTPYFFRDRFVKQPLGPIYPDDPPAVREVMIEKSRNETLHEIRSVTDRAVCVFFDARTAAELDRMEAWVNDNLEPILQSSEDPASAPSMETST